MTYKTGSLSELIAWITTTLLTGNLLIYHLYVTKDEKSDKLYTDIIDE
jgi:hypothetical protein